MTSIRRCLTVLLVAGLTVGPVYGGTATYTPQAEKTPHAEKISASITPRGTQRDNINPPLKLAQLRLETKPTRPQQLEEPTLPLTKTPEFGRLFPIDVPQDNPTPADRIEPLDVQLSCQEPRYYLRDIGTKRLEDLKFQCIDWTAHVYWVSPIGKRLDYSRWPAHRKNRLNELFHKLWNDAADLGLSCPDPHISLYYMTAAQAEDVYLAHVAHVLYMEYSNKGVIQLRHIPGAELSELLSPAAYHQPIPSGATRIVYPRNMGPGEGYRVPFGASHGRGLLCDPRDGYRFMKKHNLIGTDAEETLIKITAFFRDEMTHGAGNLANAKNHAFLRDRLVRYRNRAVNNETSYWANMGCHSAGTTFVDLARSVNIPLLSVRTRDSNVENPHSGIVYRWTREDSRILTHVDDIYTSGTTWIVFPVTPNGAQLVQASAEEKDAQFFHVYWRSPTDVRSYGFDFRLSKLVRNQPISQCASSLCDYSDNGWYAGRWRKGERESNAETALAVYAEEVKEQNASDGEPCWQPNPDVITRILGWHPECHALLVAMEEELKAVDYYEGELFAGFQLSRDFEIGGYDFLNVECNNSNHWPAYVDRQQGQPSPLNRTWQEYRTRAREIIRAYGGCETIKQLEQQILNYKKRPERRISGP